MKIFNFYTILLLFLSVITHPHYAKNADNKLRFEGIPQTIVTRSCPGASCAPLGCPTPVGGTGSLCPTQNCAQFCCVNVSQSTTTSTISASCLTDTGNLTVGGSALIQGDLVVEGTSDLKGDVCAESNVTVGINATIGGNVDIGGGLLVNNGAIINNGLLVNGDEIISGNLEVDGSQTIGQTLIVNGAASVGGLLTANGGLNIFGGETINSGGLRILSGGANITGDVIVTGNETVDDLDVLGDLTVDDNAFFNGCNTTVNGLLTANGPVVMNAGLTIASGDEVISTGNLILNNGNLSVGGFSTFTGLVTALGGAIVNNGLTVFGGETIATGGLTVANCSNVTIGGNLTVTGNITSPSAATLGSLTITSTENSTSPTTGALVVAGGLGIGRDIWIGGSEFFDNVRLQGGIPSPFNYYEETCSPMLFRTNPISGATGLVTIAIVRVGSIVNLLVPSITMSGAIPSGGVIVTSPGFELPVRFRPFCLVRGASSTIVYNPGDGLTGQLGEYEANPLGQIIFGLPQANLGPGPLTSTVAPRVDVNTITYNVLGCPSPCVPQIAG